MIPVALAPEMPAAPSAPVAPVAPASPVLVTTDASAAPAPTGSMDIVPAPNVPAGVQGVVDIASPLASLIPSTGQKLIDLGIIAGGLTVLGLGGLSAVRFGLKRR